jgi:hypothetical protein
LSFNIIEFFIGIPGSYVEARRDGSWWLGQVQLNRWLKGFAVRCHGRGYPNLKVAWKKVPNNILESLNSSTNTRVYESRDHGQDYQISYLHFNEVHCEDAGNYTCETSIEGYDYVHTQSIELICKYK